MMSIIIPHKHTPLNDMSLELNLRMIKENTFAKDYEVMVVDDARGPYTIWNDCVEEARHENVVFSNSDVLMAPGWDVHMLGYIDDNSIVTGYLVECGIIGVAPENIHKNFGMRPDNFDRGQFEQFAASQEKPECIEERGWFMPCMMRRGFFGRMGKFPDELGFPTPNDAKFWDIAVARGARLLRVNSFAYHFQYLSGRER